MQFMPFDSKVFAIRRAHTNKSAVKGKDTVSVCSDGLSEPDKNSRQRCGEHWEEFLSRMDAEKNNALKKEDLKAVTNTG
jgi:hypothetical protein